MKGIKKKKGIKQAHLTSTPYTPRGNQLQRRFQGFGHITSILSLNLSYLDLFVSSLVFKHDLKLSYFYSLAEFVVKPRRNLLNKHQEVS